MSIQALLQLEVALRLCLATLLLIAAGGKLRNRRAFVEGTIDYQIVTAPVARAIGGVLPWVELGLGLCLLAGADLPVSGAVVAVLLLAFAVAMAINLARGRRVRCNCFGIGGTTTINWGTVGRNTLLIAMAGAVAAITVATSRGIPLIVPSPDRLMVSSVQTWIVVAMIFACAMAMIYLAEWSLDIHVKISGLRTEMNDLRRVK